MFADEQVPGDDQVHPLAVEARQGRPAEAALLLEEAVEETEPADRTDDGRRVHVDVAAAAHDLAVEAELLLDFSRQTGGSRKVVSNAAVVDPDVHRDL